MSQVARRGAPTSPSATRPGQKGLPGVITELGSHDVDHAGRFGRRQHQPRLGRIGGEGLLTEDVFAGGDGLEGQGRVGQRRRGDGDGVDIGEVESLGQGSDRPGGRRIAGPVRPSAPRPVPPGPRPRNRRLEEPGRG